MDGCTLSEEVVAGGNRAKRTMLVHMYRQNRATQGQSDDNVGLVVNAIAKSRDQDFPATYLNRNNGNKANNADGPTFVGFDKPCSWFASWVHLDLALKNKTAMYKIWRSKQNLGFCGTRVQVGCFSSNSCLDK